MGLVESVGVSAILKLRSYTIASEVLKLKNGSKANEPATTNGITNRICLIKIDFVVEYSISPHHCSGDCYQTYTEGGIGFKRISSYFIPNTYANTPKVGLKHFQARSHENQHP